MKQLDLSRNGIAAWRAMLPDDLKAVVPDDQGKASDEALASLFADLSMAGHKRFAEVIFQHGEVLAAAGRSVRTRVLSWMISRSWPDAASVVNLLIDEGEEGESGGRKKVAPFFRADMEALGIVSTSRVVRAAADLRTIEAVAGGVKDFEDTYGMHRGGM